MRGREGVMNVMNQVIIGLDWSRSVGQSVAGLVAGDVTARVRPTTPRLCISQKSQGCEDGKDLPNQPDQVPLQADTDAVVEVDGRVERLAADVGADGLEVVLVEVDLGAGLGKVGPVLVGAAGSGCGRACCCLLLRDRGERWRGGGNGQDGEEDQEGREGDEDDGEGVHFGGTVMYHGG
jgi:hypothetical protein